jgi:hypothetical protein
LICETGLGAPSCYFDLFDCVNILIVFAGACPPKDNDVLDNAWRGKNTQGLIPKLRLG